MAVVSVLTVLLGTPGDPEAEDCVDGACEDVVEGNDMKIVIKELDVAKGEGSGFAKYVELGLG